MKMNEQDLIALISAYLDNALPAEETGRLLEAVRTDPAAADLMCELSIQHVQLHRIFSRNEELADCPEFASSSPYSRFRPVLRPLALAASLAIIAAAGLWLAGLLEKREASRPCSIVLFKVGQDIEDAEDVGDAPAGTAIVVPQGTMELLRFKDGTIIELEPEATVQIVNPGLETSGEVIKLLSGTLIADVTSQPAEFPLRIITPHVEVIVGGTRLTCYAEQDHTHVRIHQGWAHVVSAINGAKQKLLARHHITAGHRFHFNIRSIHEGEH